MKKKILTTSLALALGFTLIAPTTEAKADELDDLLNGATEIEEDLNQNTGDLDKLDKEKVVIPAAKIEDIAKPNKKEDKPSDDKNPNQKPSKPDEKPNPDKPSNENKKPEEKPSDKDSKEEDKKPSDDKKPETKPSTPSKEDKKEDSKNQSNKDEKVDENKKKEEKTSNGKDINLIKPSKAKENKTDDGKGKAPQTQKKNVQTGVESLNLVATTLIASIGSYLHIKKNK